MLTDTFIASSLPSIVGSFKKIDNSMNFSLLTEVEVRVYLQEHRYLTSDYITGENVCLSKINHLLYISPWGVVGGHEKLLLSVGY